MRSRGVAGHQYVLVPFQSRKISDLGLQTTKQPAAQIKPFGLSRLNRAGPFQMDSPASMQIPLCGSANSNAHDQNRIRRAFSTERCNEGHRLAASGIVLTQYAQSFVVGVGVGLFFIRFTARTSMKTANATTKNSKTVVEK
jgi:hypothetical protein